MEAEIRVEKEEGSSRKKMKFAHKYPEGQDATAECGLVGGPARLADRQSVETTVETDPAQSEDGLSVANTERVGKDGIQLVECGAAQPSAEQSVASSGSA